MTDRFVSAEDGEPGDDTQASGPESAGGDTITAGVLIEDLVTEHPGSVRILMSKGIVCIACGEPIWGSLEEAARRKELTDAEIAEVVAELNAALGKHEGRPG